MTWGFLKRLERHATLVTMFVALIMIGSSAASLYFGAKLPDDAPTLSEAEFLPLDSDELIVLGAGRQPTWGQLEVYFALTERQLERSIRATLEARYLDEGRIDLVHYRGQPTPTSTPVQISLAP